jgi:hypothetical protein
VQIVVSGGEIHAQSGALFLSQYDRAIITIPRRPAKYGCIAGNLRLIRVYLQVRVAVVADNEFERLASVAQSVHALLAEAVVADNPKIHIRLDFRFRLVVVAAVEGNQKPYDDRRLG